MSEHWHLTVDHIIIYGVSALIFFNLVKIVAAKAGAQPGPIGTAGRAVGSLVTFSGS